MAVDDPVVRLKLAYATLYDLLWRLVHPSPVVVCPTAEELVQTLNRLDMAPATVDLVAYGIEHARSEATLRAWENAIEAQLSYLEKTGTLEP